MRRLGCLGSEEMSPLVCLIKKIHFSGQNDIKGKGRDAPRVCRSLWKNGSPTSPASGSPKMTAKGLKSMKKAHVCQW